MTEKSNRKPKKMESRIKVVIEGGVVVRRAGISPCSSYWHVAIPSN